MRAVKAINFTFRSNCWEGSNSGVREEMGFFGFCIKSDVITITQVTQGVAVLPYGCKTDRPNLAGKKNRSIRLTGSVAQKVGQG